MPQVKGKHYPYTKEGIQKAQEASKKSKGYDKSVIEMAMRLRK